MKSKILSPIYFLTVLILSITVAQAKVGAPAGAPADPFEEGESFLEKLTPAQLECIEDSEKTQAGIRALIDKHAGLRMDKERNFKRKPEPADSPFPTAEEINEKNAQYIHGAAAAQRDAIVAQIEMFCLQMGEN